MPHISNTAFELDNGHMNDNQLEEKLVKHYTNIAGQLFYKKPNKVLGACYTQFLENGILYNRKGGRYREGLNRHKRRKKIA